MEPKESLQEAFDRHFIRCFLKVGDRVVFKKPKPRKKKIYGEVDFVETDLKKMFWSEAGQPRYIRIAIPQYEPDGRLKDYSYVWTNESKVVFVPPKEK